MANPRSPTPGRAGGTRPTNASEDRAADHPHDVHAEGLEQTPDDDEGEDAERNGVTFARWDPFQLDAGERPARGERGRCAELLRGSVFGAELVTSEHVPLGIARLDDPDA